MHRSPLARWVSAAFLALAGCSSAQGAADPLGSPLSGHDGGVAPDAPASDVDLESSLPSAGCSASCVAGQRCSVSGLCIPEGTCSADPDCASGMRCDAGKCVAGGGCGSESAEPAVVSPNLMIVLDRSCSMQATVGGGTKWSAALAAIETMLTSYKDKVRFGITLFPDPKRRTSGDKCTMDAVPVDVGDGSSDGVAKLLSGASATSSPLFPSGPCVTNIDTGVQLAAADPSLSDPSRTSYMLLITDGQQVVCSAAGGNTGTEKTLESMAKKGVKTFVVGYGSDIVGTDATQLGRFALYGGTALTGPTSYYQATDGPALAKALATIAASSVSCTFALSKTPADPAKIYAFFDHTKPVARDTADGWSYDASKNSVTFTGAACNEIKDGTTKRVDIVFGCNAPLPK